MSEVTHNVPEEITQEKADYLEALGVIDYITKLRSTQADYDIREYMYVIGCNLYTKSSAVDEVSMTRMYCWCK